MADQKVGWKVDRLGSQKVDRLVVTMVEKLAV
jgi:hypothetical protein